MKGPYVILTAIAKSHPFDERRAAVGSEEDPLKIGRAVARLKPSSDNAIFDCKVLSRNHAVIFYKDGDFFIKDTKSSNGTFVNNEKLPVSGDESKPRKLNTGDIVQLGVEIVENSNKVAHGCIYAMIELYDAEGHVIQMQSESTNISETDINTIANTIDASHGTFITNHHLFQLQHYIAEAVHRDNQQSAKIRELEKVLVAAEESIEVARIAVINEDRLLSRIESLEAQLAIYSKNPPQDKIKEEILSVLEDRNRFEMVSKENLRREQEELAEAAFRLSEMDRSLLHTESEITQLRKEYDAAERRLFELSEKCDQQKQEYDVALVALENSKRNISLLKQKIQEEEIRADGAIVDRELEKELPRCAENLLSALKNPIAPVAEYEGLLTKISNLLKDRGVAIPSEPVPEPPNVPSTSNENELEAPEEKKDNGQLENGYHSENESIEDLQKKVRSLTAELEAALKENLECKVNAKQYDERLLAQQQHITALERRICSISSAGTDDATLTPLSRSGSYINTFLVVSIAPVFAVILGFLYLYTSASNRVTRLIERKSE